MRRAEAEMNRASKNAALFFDSGVGAPVSLSSEIVILPGLCDVHVHFREPGFSYKETMKTGSLSAARGGYTDVCTMPNLNPVPDSRGHMEMQLSLIRESACIRVHPYGAITLEEKGETLTDMAGLAEYAVAFSDDGRGVQSDEMMRAAMLEARRLDKIIAAHCEVNDLLRGGYIHDGAYARAHGHRGICSESEWAQIKRDLALVKETGCKYHVCHISTKESVALIREAKKQGLDVTCETGPHYLTLCDEDLQEDGRFKMNPPLRSREDKEALIEGMLDGTIDIIATDHAPHSAQEKGRGLEKSLMGVVGLETAFAVMYTKFVRPGIMGLEKLVDMMCIKPRERFQLPLGNDFTVFDVQNPCRVNPEEFLSMGRATPFAGWDVYGACILTVCDGKAVYQKK